MRKLSNVFYVYVHIEPATKEPVYVGKGKYGRAWDVTRCRANNKAHQEWMMNLSHEGFIPTDWVVIIARDLTEKEAFNVESGFRHGSFKTLKFNKQSGENQHQAKMTNEEAIEAFHLAKEGTPHKEIANRFGVSRSAISMLASGKQWKAVTAGLNDRQST